jgi:hypothetical protein
VLGHAFVVFGYQGHMTINKNSIHILYLIAFLVLVFSPFGFLGEGVVVIKQLWIVWLFLFLITVYVIWFIRRGYKLSFFELYIALIIMVAPLWSAVAAWVEFGQPMMYGILSQRSFVLCASSLFLFFLVRQGYVGLPDIEKALLLLSWGCLIVFTLFSLIVDPNAYAGEVFVGGEGTELVAFKYKIYLIIFGFYYYLYLGYKKQGNLNYLYALLFLIFLVLGDGGRTMLLALSISAVFFLYRWGTLSKLMVLLPKIVVVAAVILTLLVLTREQFMSDLGNKFGDAFSVVATGEKGEDASANARIFEVLLVAPYIKENLLFGSGNISNQWHNGFEGVLGGYFYPADIGIVGSTFVFGILGTLMFMIQFIFAWRFVEKRPTEIISPLENATKAFLLYFALHSVVNGRFVLLVDISLFMVALLGLIAYSNQLNVSRFTRLTRS